MVSFMQVFDDRFQVESGWLFKKKSVTMDGNMNVNSAETGLVENYRIIPYEALNFIGMVVSSLYRKNKCNLFLNPYSTKTVNFAVHSVRIFFLLRFPSMLCGSKSVPYEIFSF